jgi:hypothetical protein
VALFNQHAADPTRQQGGRFSDLINNVANRQARPDKTDRKAAEAAAGQAQSDGTPPLGAPASRNRSPGHAAADD